MAYFPCNNVKYDDFAYIDPAHYNCNGTLIKANPTRQVYAMIPKWTKSITFQGVDLGGTRRPQLYVGYLIRNANGTVDEYITIAAGQTSGLVNGGPVEVYTIRSNVQGLQYLTSRLFNDYNEYTIPFDASVLTPHTDSVDGMWYIYTDDTYAYYNSPCTIRIRFNR